MVREALTALALAVFVSGILGVLIYLGADALIGSGSCSKRYNERQTRCLRPAVWHHCLQYLTLSHLPHSRND